MRLIDLTLVIPDLVVDMRYGTANNFTGKQLYNDAAPYANIHLAAALERAAKTLRSRSLRLVVWDAYRPEEVQKFMRSLVGNEKYVSADSNHCKGMAVDVSLADSQGRLLDMGTDFDEFTSRAHAGAELSDAQRQNRELLASAMEAVGFKQWPYEWWHFDYAQH